MIYARKQEFLTFNNRNDIRGENEKNASGGIILWDSYYEYSSPAFSGDLSLSIRDILIVELLVEALPYDFVLYDWTLVNGEPIDSTTHFKGTDLAIYTGIKTGSGWKPGFILNAAVVIGGALLLGIWAFSGGD